MPSASALRLEIERTLEHRFPAALTPAPRTIYEEAPIGVTPVDALLEGGLPIGAISEVTGPESSGRSLCGLGATTKTDAVSSFVIIFLIINFAAFLCCRECFPLSFVPANGQQLRTNGVLRHEAVVVERLE